MSTAGKVQACPCGSCVSCACAAAPMVDGDGLCVSCGGQPYVTALQGGNGPPHLVAEPGFLFDHDDLARIVEIIASEKSAAQVARTMAARALVASVMETPEQDADRCARKIAGQLGRGLTDDERADSAAAALRVFVAWADGDVTSIPRGDGAHLGDDEPTADGGRS